MKRVTFEVAKALKDAGYPQTGGDWWYSSDGELSEDFYPEYMEFFAPTYIEVWLWLWREKAVPLEILFYEPRSKWYVFCEYNEMPFKDNPEEAIVEAINHLVTNKLLK